MTSLGVVLIVVLASRLAGLISNEPNLQTRHRAITLHKHFRGTGAAVAFTREGVDTLDAFLVRSTIHGQGRRRPLPRDRACLFLCGFVLIQCDDTV